MGFGMVGVRAADASPLRGLGGVLLIIVLANGTAQRGAANTTNQTERYWRMIRPESSSYPCDVDDGNESRYKFRLKK